MKSRGLLRLQFLKLQTKQWCTCNSCSKIQSTI